MLTMAGFTSAQTWTQTTASSNSWSSIACSADGSKLVAVGNSSSPIYISTNYGATWTPNSTTTNNWLHVASSADGTKLFAASGPSQTYLSTNGGSTWYNGYAVPGTGGQISCIASSADGSKLFFTTEIAGGGILYFSTNAGLPFRRMISAPPLTSVACSADGTKLFGGGIFTTYISTNSGSSWVTNYSDIQGGSWVVASSADGTKLAAAVNFGNGDIITSTDGGTTWVTNTVPQLSWWQGISVSADGTHLVAAAWNGSDPQTGPIYTSTNSGLTWISNNVPNQTWQGLACSADGNEFVAVSEDNGNGIGSPGTGQIWISQSQPVPQLNLTPSPFDLTLAWTVPSTNFILQQSADLISWADVTDSPVLIYTNLQNQVTLSPTNSAAFYRLTTP